jgi:DNA-binding response OmpR family regulator
MARPLVEILQSNPELGQALAAGLRNYVGSAYIATSHKELRNGMLSRRPAVLVLDLELSRLDGVRELHLQFPCIPIVCTHRLPDEEMWAAALDAGASDLCPTYDLTGLVSSIVRSLEQARSVAA